MGQLAQQQAEQERRRAALEATASTLHQQSDDLRQQIGAQEDRIAAEGGSYASRRAELLAQQARCETEIEALRRRAVELANGLLPFAIAPEMLHAVRTRLALEGAFHEQNAARQLLDRQLAVLRAEMGEAAFWADEAARIAAPVREQIFRQVANNLRRAAPTSTITADELILHVSDKERTQLEQWIDAALEEAPLIFSRVIQQIAALQTAQDGLDADLARAPADAVLAPLVEQLHELLRQLGGLEQTQARLQEELRSLLYAQGQTDYALRRARAAIEQQEAAGQRVDLTARTQRVLDDYKAALTEAKVAMLEQALVSRFNELCRKHPFVERICVDLATFGITLHRADHSFPRSWLSAGENQLLAIATLWALRELSGRATPVIIDTPLSRLDSQHRQSMLHDFFPHASHQVILLATDAEIDGAALKRLAPAIARIYRMEYDPATGATTHTVETPAVVTPNLTLFEEVG